jgi:hypothetical protein
VSFSSSLADNPGTLSFGYDALRIAGGPQQRYDLKVWNNLRRRLHQIITGI